MTTVYGVTRYGANSQIYRQLKDLPEFPQDIAFRASVYLAEKTFKCLRDMFSATKEIQVNKCQSVVIVAGLHIVCHLLMCAVTLFCCCGRCCH